MVNLHISYFDVINHYHQGNLKKNSLFLVYCSKGIRVHGDIAKVWCLEKLRVHIFRLPIQGREIKLQEG